MGRDIEYVRAYAGRYRALFPIRIASIIGIVYQWLATPDAMDEQRRGLLEFAQQFRPPTAVAWVAPINSVPEVTFVTRKRMRSRFLSAAIRLTMAVVTSLWS